MATATIRPVEPETAGRILSGMGILAANILAFVPLLAALVGAGLCAWVLFRVIPNGIMADDSEWDEQLAIGVLFFGGLLLGSGGLYYTFRNMTIVSGWYLQRRARRVIKQRVDYTVDPDDPEAVFVEVVPRAHWHRMMLETATDIGFLAIDRTQSLVLFEGDREVYRIPRTALISCVVEKTLIGGNEAGLPHFFTVLIVQTASGLREIPIAYRGDMGTLGAEVREERAIGLRDRLLGL